MSVGEDTGNGRLAVLAALAANLAIAASKFVAFLISGSSSLLSESVHSLADTGNQVLLLVGGRRAARVADRAHPFGYGQDRYFYAFVVALVLFSGGALFAMFEGYEKIRHPRPLESPAVSVGVLLVAGVLEALSLRTAVRAAHRGRRGLSWVQFIRRTKAPELPVVLLEDSAALLGLLLALVGVVLSQLTGRSVFDGLGSLAIGALLAVVAVVLAVETKSLLIGESASATEVARIGAALVAAPEVTRLIHLRTMHLSPDELLIGAKVELDRALDLAGVARAIDAAEQRVRAVVPVSCVIYVEPDLYRAKYGSEASTEGDQSPAERRQG